MFAYQALKHRHDPEVRALIKAATGRDVRLAFVPHSGPFARGIHATIFLHPKERLTAAQVNEALREYYRGATFVRVDDEPPKMKDIAATNYATLRVGARVQNIDWSAFVDNLTNSTDLLSRNHDGQGSPLYYAQTFRPRTIGITAQIRY